MSESKHTPTPWRFDDNHMYVYCGDHVIVTCNDPSTAVGGLSAEEIEANAEFIVRACNAHDDLLTACEAVVLAARLKDPIAGVVAVTLAECAIAKAEVV